MFKAEKLTDIAVFKSGEENMKTQKEQKRTTQRPFNFYGIRKTRNKKYMSVTLVREDKDGEREWINVPVNMKRIKIKGDCALLCLEVLESNKDKDKDEDEDEDEDEELLF